MFIGIDLGGTKIAGGLVDRSGRVVFDLNVPTEAAKGKARVIANLKRVIDTLMKAKKVKIEAIGIGAPGPIDFARGTVVEAPNLPGWRNVNLRQVIRNEFKLPVFVDNDANCAALAEAKFGAGKKARDFIYLTVSTGIGGGIIIDRKLYRGARGAAGEFGHIILNANASIEAGRRVGSFEQLASGTAMKHNFGIDAIAAHLAAPQGDKRAIEAIKSTTEYLAVGIASLVNVFNPELVIVGGGLSNMWADLFVPVKKKFRRYCLKLPAESVKVVRAKLQADAGVIGAAALCL